MLYSSKGGKSVTKRPITLCTLKEVSEHTVLIHTPWTNVCKNLNKSNTWENVIGDRYDHSLMDQKDTKLHTSEKRLFGLFFLSFSS